MLTHETIVEAPNLKKRILAFSDVQYDQNFSKRKLRTMLAYFCRIIAQENIDYVFILGDLVNSLNVLTMPTVYQNLLDFLRTLAQSAPVIMILGNHDSYFYDQQNQLHIAPAQLYRQYLQDLDQIPNFHLLRTDQPNSPHIFDDGAIRVLGLSLPDPCYLETNSVRNFDQNGQTAFADIVKQYLPELTKVPNRDYYLLTHSPAYLRPGLIPDNVMVLAGHVHHGLVPPLLDELTKFSDRGIISPGLTRSSKYTTKYELFPRRARLRPKTSQPWLTLRPITYLADRFLRPLNIFYPSISFAIIRENHSKTTLHVEEEYHLISRHS